MQDGITSSNRCRPGPRYRLRLWRHIEPVFVMAGGPNYDIRTPGMSAGHGLVLAVRSDEKQKGNLKMLNSRIGLVVAGALVIGSSLIATGPASAADGCGPGWWRGPWGHCRDTPYTGPLPRGGYQVEFRAADN